MSKGLVVGLDFDGTVVEHRYPKVGGDVGAVPWLKQAAELGAMFVLFTMRDGDELDHAVQWFKQNGIELYGVQENPTQKKWTTSPKAYAHLYIDDCGIGIPLVRPDEDRPYVDWAVVGPMLMEHLK